jgi:predicted enzyme related to lactoylglutathione lyase
MRYVHTNIIAKDWRSLSKFYQNVFGLIPIGLQRDISGKWVDD